MKKLLFVLCIGLFAGCSNGETMSSSDTTSTRSADSMGASAGMSTDTTMRRGDTSSMPMRDTASGRDTTNM